MINLDKWMKEYESQLRKHFHERPEKYWYPENGLDLVVQKMKTAFQAGNYNKDSVPIKLTCKALGIKHTYKAINEYLKGTP